MLAEKAWFTAKKITWRTHWTVVHSNVVVVRSCHCLKHAQL